MRSHRSPVAPGQSPWPWWPSKPWAPLSCLNAVRVPESARVHVRLTGRVQGVGFRYATADEARRRSLSGWVRNLDSGGVEAVFEGTRSQVEGMLCWCEDGPPGAHVRDLNVSWDEPLEDLSTLEIRSTTVA